MSRTRNYDYAHQKSGGGSYSHKHQKFSTPAHSLASVPSSKNRYDQKIKAPDSKSQRNVSGFKN